MILQRYTFGSKSQRVIFVSLLKSSCLWYCKDIHLEANHNVISSSFKCSMLLMILQRYTFGSKSQPDCFRHATEEGCLWYCKDIHLEANHNSLATTISWTWAAYDIAKIYIWKQITTSITIHKSVELLLMILQRYTFGSKSQLPNLHYWK